MGLGHRVIVSPRVTANLFEQEDYLAERASPAVAEAYIERLVAYIADLGTFPDRGHRRHDILPGLTIIGYRGSANLAVVIERPYVYVVGVYFGGEDYESELYELDMQAIKRGEYGVA